MPWNFAVVALALAPALIPIAATAGSLGADAAERDGAVRALTAADLWSFTVTYLLLATVVYAVLAAIFRANEFDLGLPQSAAQLGRDAAVGTIAYLAVLVPVYAIQIPLTLLFSQPDATHPIVVTLEGDNSAAMMVAAAVGACLGAPLFEETAFRLVFQGWLEKHGAPVEELVVEEQAVEEPTLAVLPMGIGELDEAGAQPQAEVVAEFGAHAFPVVGNVADRPCNWGAILVTSALFSLAHVGQGVAPFSLFPLGVALGYLYQRTHRIVPSMVCHALFNATTLMAVWMDAAGE